MSTATLLGLMLPCVVHAEGESDLRFTGAVGIIHDSNLFRLPPGADADALIGRPSPSETIVQKSVGLKYGKSYSLQRIEFDADIVDYQYQNFKYLDFSTINYNGTWRWGFTPHMYGSISTSREKALNNFADVQSYNQRNERLDKNHRLDATYELGANWRLLGALSRMTQTNSQPLIEESDYQRDSVDTGVRYALASGSSLTYLLRNIDGNYINRPNVSAGLFDSRFSQKENEVQLNVAVTENTELQFRLGYRKRTHPNYPSRNFEGTTGRANLNWNLSSKTEINAGWSRELAAYETVNSNFSQTDRIFIGSVWQFSPKVSSSVRLTHSIRNFGGSPGPALPSQRQDNYDTATLAFKWQPYSALSLNAALQTSRRNSSEPGLDFRSNGLTVSAQLAY